MKVFYKLLDFYINSSIHVAIAIVCLTCVSYKLHNVTIDIDLILFIFFGSITAYNFVKYASIAKFKRSGLSTSLKLIQFVSLISFLSLAYFVFKQTFSVLLISGIMGIVTLLYTLPVFSRNRNLRTIAGLKIYIIALVCATITVVLPLHLNVVINDVIVEFIQRFILVIVLVLPFEIRDLQNDSEALETIPQKIGIHRSKNLGYIFLAIIFLLEFTKRSIEYSNLLSLGILVFISMSFVYFSTVTQKKYYASFWVEAIPIIWLGIVTIFKI